MPIDDSMGEGFPQIVPNPMIVRPLTPRHRANAQTPAKRSYIELKREGSYIDMNL